MPFRPIIQTASDGTKSINFSDGGRWDGGQIEDRYFKGVLQAPTKTCWEQFTPDTYEEERVRSCYTFTRWVQEKIGTTQICGIAAPVIRPQEPIPLTQGSVPANDFSQFNENDSPEDRILPSPHKGMMSAPAWQSTITGSDRMNLTTSSGIANSKFLVISGQDVDLNYRIAGSSVNAKRLAANKLAAITSIPALPITSGIQLEDFQNIGDGKIRLQFNKNISIPSGTRLTFRKQQVQYSAPKEIQKFGIGEPDIGSPPPEPNEPDPLPPEDPGPEYECVCETVPIFKDVEKEFEVCEWHTVLRKIPGEGGRVPCGWPQDYGDATKGSPAVIKRSIQNIDISRFGRATPAKYSDRESTKIDIKFDPNLDVTQITGATLSLDKTPDKVLSLRIKGKFKTRVIWNTNVDQYYRYRSSLPIAKSQTESGVFKCSDARKAEYFLGSNGRILDISGKGGNRISTDRQAPKPAKGVPLEGRPVNFALLQHQMFTDEEISLVNENRKSYRINSPDDAGRPGTVMTGPVAIQNSLSRVEAGKIATGGLLGVGSYHFNGRSTNDARAKHQNLIYTRSIGTPTTCSEKNAQENHLVNHYNVYPDSYWPNYGYIDTNNTIHIIPQNNVFKLNNWRSISGWTYREKAMVANYPGFLRYQDPPITRQEGRERYLPAVVRSPDTPSSDIPAWGKSWYDGASDTLWQRACSRDEDSCFYSGPKNVYADLYPKMYSANDEWTYWGDKMADRGVTVHGASFQPSGVPKGGGGFWNNIRDMGGEFDISIYGCTEATINFAEVMNLDYHVEWYWEVVNYNAAYGTHNSPQLSPGFV